MRSVAVPKALATDGRDTKADARAHPGACAPGDAAEHAPWYRSPATWRFVLARFVPLLTVGNLIWEILQLPLYTLWLEGTPQLWIFAIVHCTIGDVIIGTAALFISVVLFSKRGWPRIAHGRVLITATFAGVAYTILSEWANTQVTMNWQYAESMLRVPPLGTGIAPLLQWMVVPPLAYWLAAKSEEVR